MSKTQKAKNSKMSNTKNSFKQKFFFFSHIFPKYWDLYNIQIYFFFPSKDVISHFKKIQRELSSMKHFHSIKKHEKLTTSVKKMLFLKKQLFLEN